MLSNTFKQLKIQTELKPVKNYLIKFIIEIIYTYLHRVLDRYY